MVCACSARTGTARRTACFTDRVGVLTNDFFVNLLDLGTTWKPLDPGSHAFMGDGCFRRGDVGIGTPRRPAVRLELRAARARRGVRQRRRPEKFVRDFVAAWGKVTELDRFDLPLIRIARQICSGSSVSLDL